jgi:hypothetical protein
MGIVNSTRQRVHRRGNTAIVLAWSPINVVWLVWREDGSSQGLVRTHARKTDAEADYFRRVEFLDEVITLEEEH